MSSSPSIRILTKPVWVLDTNVVLDLLHFADPLALPILQALETAAYSGVKVTLLIPSRNDSRLVLWAGRSFYGELIRAGVEIYEFDHGMLHNKVFVVDGRWSMVGSANMDHRSFHLNFELSTILYDEGLAQELLKDFASFLKQSRRIGEDGKVAWTRPQMITLGAARLDKHQGAEARRVHRAGAAQVDHQATGALRQLVQQAHRALPEGRAALEPQVLGGDEFHHLRLGRLHRCLLARM